MWLKQGELWGEDSNGDSQIDSALVVRVKRWHRRSLPEGRYDKKGAPISSAQSLPSARWYLS